MDILGETLREDLGAGVYHPSFQERRSDDLMMSDDGG